MKNRWLPVVTIILLVALLITGCGISQSQYDAIAAELDQAKQDQLATQTELETAHIDLEATQMQLQTAQSELTTTRTDLQTAQTDSKVSQVQLQAAQDQLQIVQSDRQATQTQLATVQSELTETLTTLETAQDRIRSLQEDQDAADGKRAEALGYAEYVDISMIELFMAAGVDPRYTVSSSEEWYAAMHDKADSLGDTELVNYIEELENGTNDKDAYLNLLSIMWYHCLGKIEQDME